MLRLSRPTRAAARQVQRDERGFTLVEMLVGISIGVIVVFAAYTAIDAANRSQLRTSMRIDAINRGRNGMEAITRAIRSQQCFNSTRPMISASATSMEFYASVAPGTTPGKQPIERHRLQWVPRATEDVGAGTTPTGTAGDIVQTVWRSRTVGTSTTFPTQPESINVVATLVQPGPDRRNPAVQAPIFRYFKYASTTGSGRVDLTAPVTTAPNAAATDLAGIVLIEISYQSVPRKTRIAPSKALNFYNTVSVRIADPTNPAGSPQCL